MSKGTPITHVRLSDKEREMINDMLSAGEENDAVLPKTVTDYIRAAVREKAAKRKRSAHCPTRRRLRRERQYHGDGSGI